jgi:hypothetical protein
LISAVPSMRGGPRGLDVAVAAGAGDRPVEHVVDERALARAARPRHRHHHAEGDASPSRRAGCWRARRSGSCAPCSSRALRALRAEPGERAPDGEIHAPCELVRRPSKTSAPPCTPAPGPSSIARSQARITSGSCSITSTTLPRRELAHRPDERRGCLEVQPHRGLVEDEERARERGAERRGERDALRLAARERARLPIEREVAEAHALEVREPLESSARAISPCPSPA